MMCIEESVVVEIQQLRLYTPVADLLGSPIRLGFEDDVALVPAFGLV